jgi:hypothetical protein
MKRLKHALWFSNGESRIIDGFKLAVKAFDAWLWIIRNPYDERIKYWFFESLKAEENWNSKCFIKDYDGSYFWGPF